MTKTQKIFEAVVVIIGMIILVGWLYVMFSIKDAPPTGEQSPIDCFTPAGDSC